MLGDLKNKLFRRGAKEEFCDEGEITNGVRGVGNIPSRHASRHVC
jgi:hypothetical protein